jgi:hypothetical protein
MEQLAKSVRGSALQGKEGKRDFFFVSTKNTNTKIFWCEKPETSLTQLG